MILIYLRFYDIILFSHVPYYYIKQFPVNIMVSFVYGSIEPQKNLSKSNPDYFNI